MTPAELVRQIKQNKNYWNGLEITPQQIEALTNFSPEEYDNVVCTFMQEPVRNSAGLHGVDYRETYAHLVYGTVLSILRPNPDLYSTVLAGVLQIADPSSISYGAFALRQLMPTEKIVRDLQKISDKHQDDKGLLSHIAWLLYWLGFSDTGQWRMPYAPATVEGDFASLVIETVQPTTDYQEVAKMTEWASGFMKLHYG